MPTPTPPLVDADRTPLTDSAAARVLRGAARGLLLDRGGFQAAELWLLDDQEGSPTGPELKLVARWADPDGAIGDARSMRRRLADAPADVAALAGGAVALEKPEDLAEWQSFDPGVAAGLCLPVASANTIHGVVWLLADRSLPMPDEAVELAEIVAARIALELDKPGHPTTKAKTATAATNREGDGRTEKSPSQSDPPEAASLIAVAAEPRTDYAAVAPVEAAGWLAAHAADVSLAACHELPGSRLLAVSAAAIDSPESTIESQQATIAWLREELLVAAPLATDAGELLTRLNQRLIESPLAGEGLAIAAALIDPPEDAEAGLGGAGTYAVAGPTVALTVRAAATDPHAGDLVPIGWSEPEASYAPRPFQLPVRGRLVLVAGDPALTSPLRERRIADAYRSATAEAHREMDPFACLRRLERSGVEAAWSAVAVRRG